MHPSLILFGTAAVASAAAVSPRSKAVEWKISNFTAVSKDDMSMVYNLEVHHHGRRTKCHTETSLPSTTCLGTYNPSPFNVTPCDDKDHWSWSLNTTEGAEYGGVSGFSLKVAHERPGQETLYGCRFFPDTTQCNYGATNETIWVVPTSFNLTTSTNPVCIYA